MGRKAKIRVSYSNDAAYLIRLGQAVEADPKADTAWKRRAMELLNELVNIFLEQAAKAVSVPPPSDPKKLKSV